MKVRISMIAETSVLIDLMLMTTSGKVVEKSIEIELIQNGEARKAAIRKAFEKSKAKPKRKPGRPAMGIPGKVLAAVRQLQDSAVAKNGGGAPLTEIKKIVKSSSTSPVLTDLIKHKKLARVSTGHYRVA